MGYARVRVSKSNDSVAEATYTRRREEGGRLFAAFPVARCGYPVLVFKEFSGRDGSPPIRPRVNNAKLRIADAGQVLYRALPNT